MTEALLRCAKVAALTGVCTHTLRVWERRYGIPKPSRTASNYRLYGSADVDQIRRMKAFTGKGVAAGEAAAAVRQSLLAAPSPESFQPLSEAHERLEKTLRRVWSRITPTTAEALDALLGEVCK